MGPRPFAPTWVDSLKAQRYMKFGFSVLIQIARNMRIRDLKPMRFKFSIPTRPLRNTRLREQRLMSFRVV